MILYLLILLLFYIILYILCLLYILYYIIFLYIRCCCKKTIEEDITQALENVKHEANETVREVLGLPGGSFQLNIFYILLKYLLP